MCQATVGNLLSGPWRGEIQAKAAPRGEPRGHLPSEPSVIHPSPIDPLFMAEMKSAPIVGLEWINIPAEGLPID
jgi:hypothetical protein